MLWLLSLVALADTPQTIPTDEVTRVVRQGMGLRLVHVWATWCKPCVAEFDRLDALTEEWHGQGLTVVALSLDPDDAPLERFLRDKRTTWQHYRLRDLDGQLRSEFADLGGHYDGAVPTNLLLGADGSVLHEWSGTVSEAELRQRIEPHLSGPVGSTGPTAAQLAAVETGTLTVVLEGREGDPVYIDNWNAGTLPLTTEIVSGLHDFRVEGEAGTVQAEGVQVAFDRGATTVDLADAP